MHTSFTDQALIDLGRQALQIEIESGDCRRRILRLIHGRDARVVVPARSRKLFCA